jgi:hypothetical protein
VLLIAVLVSFIAVLAGSMLPKSRSVRIASDRSRALQVSETGIDRAIWCLNHSTQCASGYSGETQAIGAGSYTVAVTPSGSSKILTSTGTVNSQARTVEVTVTNQSSTEASFYYGVQAGVGGFQLSNNAFINGNVYSMGSVLGSNGSYITGDAILTISNPTQDAVSNPSVSPLNTLTFGSNGSTNDVIAQSFVPTVSDRVYSIDLKIAKTNSPTSTVTVLVYSDSGNNPDADLTSGGQVLSVAVPNDTPAGWEAGWTTQTFTPSTNPVLTAGQKYWLVLRTNTTSSTRYWKVVRSTDDTPYANGTAKIDGDTTAMPAACAGGCDIAFRMNMGGVPPTLNIPNVNGNAYSRTITNTTIGQKAYYQNLSGTVRANGGSDTCTEGENGPYCFDDTPDQPPADFPISEAQVTQMEAQAEAGGITTCTPTCTLASGTIIGPQKYVGDLVITNSAVITLAGTVWVDGNITLSNNAILQLSSGYGTSSGIIIADSPSARTVAGKISLSNNGDLRGNANPGTYIMALSMYRDPADLQSAVDVANNLTAGIVYAPEGMITIANNAGLKEVTARKISLLNNASVTYESGLASVVFSNGPGGSWAIQDQSWREVP